MNWPGVAALLVHTASEIRDRIEARGWTLTVTGEVRDARGRPVAAHEVWHVVMHPAELEAERVDVVDVTDLP